MGNFSPWQAFQAHRRAWRSHAKTVADYPDFRGTPRNIGLSPLHGTLLGLPSVLVSDFYAVYDGLKCLKLRCLPHLLRTLHKLRAVATPHAVSYFLQTVMDLLKNAIAWANSAPS